MASTNYKIFSPQHIIYSFISRFLSQGSEASKHKEEKTTSTYKNTTNDLCPLHNRNFRAYITHFLNRTSYPTNCNVFLFVVVQRIHLISLIFPSNFLLDLIRKVNHVRLPLDFSFLFLLFDRPLSPSLPQNTFPPSDDLFYLKNIFLMNANEFSKWNGIGEENKTHVQLKYLPSCTADSTAHTLNSMSSLVIIIVIKSIIPVAWTCTNGNLLVRNFWDLLI